MKKNIGGISSSEYSTIHHWLRSHYGSASKCEEETCKGDSKHYQWSLIYGHKYEKKRENFRMLCGSCHMRYDYNKPESRKNMLARLNNQFRTVLTDEIADEIRARYRVEGFNNVGIGGLTYSDLAKQYGVHKTTIEKLINFRTWTITPLFSIKDQDRIPVEATHCIGCSNDACKGVSISQIRTNFKGGKV